ncbi:MAG: Flagellar assembly protein FapA [Thermodesulfobacterium sp.]|uniref:Flagellar assembly protein FapA n=1 Tax=Candidatus Thermodesulfobacterium syntrophicum TaxID=3060442 RepID=A0AAE3TEJ1_9BACT|nr:Flagellar assembly protein FapA [Candidatus Thermodesulfobacterium syntrophicum]
MIDRIKAKQEGIVIDDLVIKVSPDDMYLYLEVDPKDPILINILQEKWEKVKTTLKENKIKGILEEPEFVENMLIVAKGIPPKDPIPEKIEFFDKFLSVLQKDKNLEQKCKEASEKEAEDLRDLCQSIICAKKGEAIGRWYPSIPGTPGINIWGDPIEPPPLSERPPFTLGSNLYIDEKDNLIKAKESGVLIIEKNIIEIYPEYTLKSDVDFSTGNVYFIGKKLTIEGDIKFGFKVICEGELELHGATENKVYIEVKGSFVCQGIVRGEETKLKVRGDAEIKTVEYGILEIEGNLNITNYLIFSNCIVYGNLIATSGKGIIYGGEVKCGGNISVKILGNENHTPTKVFAGYNPSLMEPYKKALEKEIEIKKVLERLEQGIKLGKKIKKYGKLSEQKEKILSKLEEEAEKCYKSLEKIKETLNNLKKLIAEYKSKTIKILDKVYAGVTIGITDITYTLNEDKTGPITFYLEADKPMFKD